MKISSKKQLRFVIEADFMMNRGYFHPTLAEYIKRIFVPDYIMDYMVAMRCVSYYKNKGGINRLIFLHYLNKYRRLGIKLGFSIGYNVFGYGLVLPHYGTIVVGGSNHIGNYAVLQTSVCISDNGKTIGDGLYCSTGVKMTSSLTLGDFISIGANSLVNKSYDGNNALLGGMPAKYIKEEEAWYIRDHFDKNVYKIEELKKKYGL